MFNCVHCWNVVSASVLKFLLCSKSVLTIISDNIRIRFSKIIMILYSLGWRSNKRDRQCTYKKGVDNTQYRIKTNINTATKHTRMWKRQMLAMLKVANATTKKKKQFIHKTIYDDIFFFRYWQNAMMHWCSLYLLTISTIFLYCLIWFDLHSCTLIHFLIWQSV